MDSTLQDNQALIDLDAALKRLSEQRQRLVNLARTSPRVGTVEWAHLGTSSQDLIEACAYNVTLSVRNDRAGLRDLLEQVIMNQRAGNEQQAGLVPPQAALMMVYRGMLVQAFKHALFTWRALQDVMYRIGLALAGQTPSTHSSMTRISRERNPVRVLLGEEFVQAYEESFQHLRDLRNAAKAGQPASSAGASKDESAAGDIGVAFEDIPRHGNERRLIGVLRVSDLTNAVEISGLLMSKLSDEIEREPGHPDSY